MASDGPKRGEEQAPLVSDRDLQARGLFKAEVVRRETLQADEDDEDDMRLSARDWFFLLVRPKHVQPLAWLLTFALVLFGFAACLSLL